MDHVSGVPLDIPEMWHMWASHTHPEHVIFSVFFGQCLPNPPPPRGHFTLSYHLEIDQLCAAVLTVANMFSQGNYMQTLHGDLIKLFT